MSKEGRSGSGRRNNAGGHTGSKAPSKSTQGKNDNHSKDKKDSSGHHSQTPKGNQNSGGPRQGQR